MQTMSLLTTGYIGMATHLLRRSINFPSMENLKMVTLLLEWIVHQGKVLAPALSQNIKHDRGFQHDHTGFLLCPTIEDWNNQEYDCFGILFDMYQDW